jgi:hypothetical protein
LKQKSKCFILHILINTISINTLNTPASNIYLLKSKRHKKWNSRQWKNNFNTFL